MGLDRWTRSPLHPPSPVRNGGRCLPTVYVFLDAPRKPLRPLIECLARRRCDETRAAGPPHGSIAGTRSERRWLLQPRGGIAAGTDGRRLLTALSLTLLAQLVRAYVPLAFELGEEIGGNTGYLIAGAVAAAVFASPALGGVLAGRGRVALVSGVVLLAAARVTIQLVHPIPVWLGTVALAVGLVVLPSIVAAVRRAHGDDALLTGVLLGLALDTAIRGGFLTGSAAWQEDPIAIGVAIGLGVLAIVAALAIPLDAASAQPPALRLALFGPFLCGRAAERDTRSSRFAPSPHPIRCGPDWIRVRHGAARRYHVNPAQEGRSGAGAEGVAARGRPLRGRRSA